MERALAFIDQHLGERLTRFDFAEAIEVSPYHFG
jgi:hypothetical protein